MVTCWDFWARNSSVKFSGDTWVRLWSLFCTKAVTIHKENTSPYRETHGHGWKYSVARLWTALTMKGSKGSADPLWNFYLVLRCCWCQGLIGIGGLVSGVAGIVYQGLRKQLLFHGGNKHLSSIETWYPCVCVWKIHQRKTLMFKVQVTKNTWGQNTK